MNYCTNCGNVINDGDTQCAKCGAAVNSQTGAGQAQNSGYIPTTHDIPKCTCCGHIGPMKTEALFTPMEIFLAIFFLILGVVPGLIYIGVHILRFGSKKNRRKICTKCKSKDMYTYVY